MWTNVPIIVLLVILLATELHQVRRRPSIYGIGLAVSIFAALVNLLVGPHFYPSYKSLVTGAILTATSEPSWFTGRSFPYATECTGEIARTLFAERLHSDSPRGLERAAEDAGGLARLQIADDFPATAMSDGSQPLCLGPHPSELGFAVMWAVLEPVLADSACANKAQ
jgi:hypothetical protein